MERREGRKHTWSCCRSLQLRVLPARGSEGDGYLRGKDSSQADTARSEANRTAGATPLLTYNQEAPTRGCLELAPTPCGVAQFD